MSKVRDLKANPNNPRLISAKQLEMLKKSLDRFGELNCLVFNERSQMMVGGHQRLKTLPPESSIEWTTVYPTPTRTGTVKEGHVDVDGDRLKIRAVDWDEAKEKAAVIAANQHGGEFDMAVLPDWINEITNLGVDLDVLGFTQQELDEMLAKNEPAPMPQHKEPVETDIECPECGHEFST